MNPLTQCFTRGQWITSTTFFLSFLLITATIHKCTCTNCTLFINILSVNCKLYYLNKAAFWFTFPFISNETFWNGLFIKENLSGIPLVEFLTKFFSPSVTDPRRFDWGVQIRNWLGEDGNFVTQYWRKSLNYVFGLKGLQ